MDKTYEYMIKISKKLKEIEKELKDYKIDNKEKLSKEIDNYKLRFRLPRGQAGHNGPRGKDGKVRSDFMRYIVNKADNGYEFTHIEEKETLTGEKVEVIKGKNVLTEEKITETISQLKEDLENKEKLITKKNIKKTIEEYKEEVQSDIDLVNTQIETLNKFLEEINKVK